MHPLLRALSVIPHTADDWCALGLGVGDTEVGGVCSGAPLLLGCAQRFGADVLVVPDAVTDCGATVAVLNGAIPVQRFLPVCRYCCL